ncbi:sodium:solute symporter family protein [Pseudoalteromonas tunicata]|uniref:sodium:solute symporter family protein n=1 Tax=Pseudoalteromonas tunicata TaxID=314281 RepID=UPI00273D3B38|nr:sodium:solute symporter family protein [Pseudoalteromonas tunicata]MDP4983510.1 sodium:solute symporter family protein [Pseudoalteromonas tunicata]
MKWELLLAFLGYLGFMIWFGWWVSRNTKGGDDFLLGGRNLPFFLTLGTTVATMVGTGSSMGAVGFAYLNGWAGMIYGLGGACGILLLAKVFAPVREHQFMTMSEEVSYYVGAHPIVKNTIAVFIFIASIGWLGAHILGGGMYLAWLTGLSPFSAKLIIALGFSIYVVIGGYVAVVWTDSIQAVVLFVGFFLMAGVALYEVGGVAEMASAQPVLNQSFLSLDKVGLLPGLSLFFAVLVGVLVAPSFRQRIYSGKHVKSIRQSFYTSGGLYLLFAIVPAIIGMAAFKLNPDLENSAFSFPYMAMELLPFGLAALVIIAGLSATISSASSDAIAAVSVLIRDLYCLVFNRMPHANEVVMLSRFGLVLTIGIALLLALLTNDVIGYITNMIATLMSGLCVSVLFGHFWSRFNWQGVMTALFVSLLVSFAIILTPDWLAYWSNPIIPATTISAILAAVVTLLTPVQTRTSMEALAILKAQREEMQHD